MARRTNPDLPVGRRLRSVAGCWKTFATVAEHQPTDEIIAISIIDGQETTLG
ncbi:MAG: hypothetical protein OTI34_14410 [Lewinella sp.]|nr:hypothetical protein [Lewinella sp.]